MTLDLDKLEALWEKATSGEWTLHENSATTVIGDDHTVANTGGYSTTERDMYEELVANASLIVSMKNGLPELLKLARGTAHARREALEEKDEAYRQRNVLVAALASLFPSGIRRTSIEGWSDDWNGCCYIDLPSGQISYHYHDSQAHLFAGLPLYTKAWDGHDKQTVESRLLSILNASPGSGGQDRPATTNTAPQVPESKDANARGHRLPDKQCEQPRPAEAAPSGPTEMELDYASEVLAGGYDGVKLILASAVLRWKEQSK